VTIDRAERAGFGVAAAGHLLLFGVLSAGWFASPPPLQLKRQPVEVELVDETGLESGAPQISTEAPAAKRAELEGPIEAAPPIPAPVPEPVLVPPPPKAAAVPAPAPAPVPKPAKQPAPKAAPTPAKAAAKPTPAKPAAKPAAKSAPKQASAARGRLDGLLEGISDKPSESRSTAPRASVATPAVQASLRSAVLRQLKPHWKAPTGADAELLRTELSITLARDGTVTDIEVLGQTGITASNRAQAKLHQEQAIKAVRLASPFELPAAYYDTWKILSPIGFDKRLSQ
jgi:outer membrane biosynthesis protein TonB